MGVATKGDGMAFQTTTTGLKIHVLGDGPEAVLCHASLGVGRFLFHQLIPVWARTYTVVSWDQRGVGENRGMAASLSGWVQDAEEILAMVGKPSHLVGISVGAAIMARLAVTTDPLIRSAVLVGAAMDDTAASLSTPSRGAALAAGMEAMARQYVEDTLTPYVQRETHDNLIREMADQDPQQYLDTLEMVYAMDNRATFAAIAVPTLVVVGALDRKTPPAQADAIASCIPRSRTEVILRAGHLVPLDQPRRLERLCQEFWATCNG